jgi:hypothetical protein
MYSNAAMTVKLRLWRLAQPTLTVETVMQEDYSALFREPASQKKKLV